MGGADAPYPEVVRERADEAVARQRAALAEGRAAVEEAQRRLEAAGIKGDVAALAATLDRKGRASSLLPELISGDIPVWDVRGTVINSPADMYAALYPIRSPYFESFKVAVLSDDNVVVHSQIVTVGTINASLIEPTQLLGVLARVRAATGKKYNRIILAHNHPSGDPMPSAEDIAVTKRVTKAAEALGFEVLDHVITDGENYASLKELGLHASVSAGRAARAPKALERKPAPALPPEGKAPWELTQRGPKLIPLTDRKSVV